MKVWAVGAEEAGGAGADEEKPSMRQRTILWESAHLERMRSSYHDTLFRGLVCGIEGGFRRGGWVPIDVVCVDGTC